MGNRIVVYDIVDDEADFHVIDAPMPEVGAGEVRFRVAAFGLNQADLMLTQGRHYVASEFPIRLGYEGCGTVDAIGPGVTRWKIGDRVSAIPNVDGPYATAGRYALADERFLVRWPDGWSAAQATSFCMQALTAYFPFADLFPIERDEWVLITAASGATGLGAVRIAKMLGARVIATTRSASKAAALRAHGADVVLSTDQQDFVAQVREATAGAGVKLVFDALSGPYVEMLVETLAQRGIIVIYGALSGNNVLTLPSLNLIHRGGGVYGYSLINELRIVGKLEHGCGFMLDAIAQGTLGPPLVDRIFPFEAVRQAYAWMHGGKQTGKIVVAVE